MKTEPTLNYDSLLKRINELYQLSAQTLTFVPEGECSIGYVLRCSGSKKYFLKLWGNNRQGLRVRSKLDIVLPIIYELFNQNLVTNLPAPIAANSGKLYSSFSDYALALFPYINGRPIIDPIHPCLPHVNARVAETMAALHQATHQLDVSRLKQSAFELNFAAEMRWGLSALTKIGSRHPPGQIQLRNMLLPQYAALLVELDRLEASQKIILTHPRQLVLCHTDMGGNNVLVDSSDKVFVLDWDDLILAPAEHDLQEYRADRFSDFLKMYLKAGGVSDLSPAQFEFYLLRRYLGDLTDWLLRILMENVDPEQDTSDLQGIEEYCLPHLAHFENEMADITKAINFLRC